jgi:hypothetical protein
MLVGCKRDFRDFGIPNPAERCITYNEGDALAKEIHARRYFECSAKTTWGVNELFEAVAWLALKYGETITPDTIIRGQTPSGGNLLKKGTWRRLFSRSSK